MESDPRQLKDSETRGEVVQEKEQEQKQEREEGLVELGKVSETQGGSLGSKLDIGLGSQSF